MESSIIVKLNTKEEWDEFYKITGSNFLQMEQDIMTSYGDKQLEMYNNILDFIYKLVGTIGIVAGFGFTAVNFVESIHLFYVAEILFFAAMAIGVHWVSKTYQSEFTALQKSSSKLSKIFRKRTSVLGIIVKNYGETNCINTENLKEMDACDQELLTAFSQTQEESSLKTPIPLMIVLFSLGGCVLLTSFLS
jgi:hypothetical protein